jgi:hypothetical protein
MANYVFNDTTGVQDGLIQECEDICNLGAGGISGSIARLKTFTRRLNQAKDKVFLIFSKVDSLWKFDDRRYSDSDQDLPIWRTNLTSGTSDYLLDEDIQTIEQVFIKNASDEYVELEPQDDRNAPDAYKTQVSGQPTKYELVGNSLVFDKIPNYTPTVVEDGKNYGIKVVGKRKFVNFNYTDGAVAISVPQVVFEYLANKASLPFLREKGLKHYNAVKQDVLEAETIHLPHFISNRAKPKRAGLKIRQESNK